MTNESRRQEELYRMAKELGFDPQDVFVCEEKEDHDKAMMDLLRGVTRTPKTKNFRIFEEKCPEERIAQIRAYAKKNWEKLSQNSMDCFHHVMNVSDCHIPARLYGRADEEARYYETAILKRQENDLF